MIVIPKEIQDKMLADAVKYNIRLHFPNGERTDITCNQIVEGSVKFTESLVSQDELKFGLCESPIFECKTVGVGNIKGARIELTYEVYCDANTPGAEFRTDLQSFVFPIQKGVFIVASAERQADMQHRKIVAYGGGAATDWDMPKYLEAQSLPNETVQIDISSIVATKFKNEVERELLVNKRDTTLDPNVENIRVEYASNGSSVIQNAIIRASFKALMDIDSVINDIKKHMPISSYVEDALRKRIPSVRYGNQYIGIKNGEQIFSISFYQFPDFSIPIRIYTTDGELSYDMVDRDSIKFEKMISNIPPYNVSVNIKTFQDFLKTDLLSTLEAILEMNGKIGRISNYNALDIIDVKKQFYLLPNDDLMPDAQLKPLGVNGSSIGRNQYSSLWYEESYTKPYGRVYCEYTNKSGTQSVRNIYINGFDSNSDPNEYLMYSLTSNEIIQNNQYSQEEITAIMEVIAESIKGVSYVPLKLKCVSIPFVECGDTLEVLTQNNDSITTIVMKRTLIGESYITDEFTSV